MVALSYLTGSIWALVAGLFASSTLTTIWSHVWIHGTTNRLAWHKPSLREFAATGRWIMLSSCLFVLASQIDRYLLAGFISPTELGLYSIALNLVMMVEVIGGRFIGAVALPSLSATARDEPDKLSKQLYRLRLPADIAFLFAAGFLFATGAVIVEILYDKRYVAAGQMLQILSFLLVGSRHNILNSVYAVIGRPHFVAYVSMVKCISSVVFMSAMFVLYGLPGALVAVSLQTIPPLFFMFWLNKSHGLNNFRFELGILLFWPVGYISGALAMKVGMFAKAMFS
jgi:O-antigen/teichoic acid export membrane protein